MVYPTSKQRPLNNHLVEKKVIKRSQIGGSIRGQIVWRMSHFVGLIGWRYRINLDKVQEPVMMLVETGLEKQCGFQLREDLRIFL